MQRGFYHEVSPRCTDAPDDQGGDGGQGKQAEDGDGHRRRFDDDGKRTPSPFRVDQLSFERRRSRKCSLPEIQGAGGNDRVAEHHADQREQGAVTDAGEQGDAEVGEEMTAPRAGGQVLDRSRDAHRKVDQQVAEEGAGHEQHRHRGHRGDVLPHYHHLAAKRRQQQVVQAALEDLAAEQVEEDVQATGEQDGAEEDGLEDGLVPGAIAEPFQHRLPADGYRADEQDDHDGYRRREPQDHRPAGQQQPAQFEAHQSADLPAEQRPVEARAGRCLRRHGHDGSPSSVIR